MIELFQRISGNNYTLVYLTARSMANDADTRKYLFQVSLSPWVLGGSLSQVSLLTQLIISIN